MNTEEILRRARALLDLHGLHDWELRLDHARRRAGCCYYQRQEISLSQVLLPEYSPEAVDEVILHEIAHALVGPGRGHDGQWRRTAARIGATPRARIAGQPAPTAPWVGTCPSCGIRRELYRVPRRVVSCGRCSRKFDTRYLFSWTHDGQSVSPGGVYAQELARMRKAHQ